MRDRHLYHHTALAKPKMWTFQLVTKCRLMCCVRDVCITGYNLQSPALLMTMYRHLIASPYEEDVPLLHDIMWITHCTHWILGCGDAARKRNNVDQSALGYVTALIFRANNACVSNSTLWTSAVFFQGQLWGNSNFFRSDHLNLDV